VNQQKYEQPKLNDAVAAKDYFHETVADTRDQDGEEECFVTPCSNQRNKECEKHIKSHKVHKRF